MSELNAKRWIAVFATALLLTPVLAAQPDTRTEDWPVANPIDAHSTWYNWTLDDAAGYTLDNTSMSGGGLWLAPYDGNFSMNGSGLSSEAQVTWGSIAVSATFYWFSNASIGETVQINVSWSEDNSSWSPEITLGANGTSVEPAHAYYRWNATLSAPTNATTPTLWWVGLLVVSNTGPFADAGVDFSATVSAGSQLDGSLSGDADLDTLTYLWTQTGGPATPITNANLAIADIWPLAVGMYTFELNVTDGSEYATDSVVVTVANVPPIADAGLDQTTVRNATVYLNGNGSSDADGNLISFNWTVLSAPEVVTLNNGTTVLADFVPMMVGTYSFNLTVMDNESASAWDWVDIFVADLAPTADAGLGQFVFKNALVTLDGSASMDLDGDPLWYDWTQVSGPSAVTLSGANGTLATFTAPNGAFGAGNYTFDLLVWDSFGMNSTDTVFVNVSNRGPTADAGLDMTIVGQLSVVTLDGSASTDPDAEAITYLWTQTAGPGAAPSNPTSAITDFTAVGLGIYTYDLMVTDTDGASATDSVTFNVTNAAPIAALVANPNPVLMGSNADVNASGSVDTDGTILLYNFTYGDGNFSGDIASSSTTYSWAAPGAYMVTVTVWDNDGASDTAGITVNVVTDLPPTAVAAVTPGTTGTLATTFNFDATGSTDDNLITAYLWDFGDGTPTATTALANHQYAARGPFVATLTVWDVLNQNTSDTLTIDVQNRAPTADAGTPQTVPKGLLVTMSASASMDLDGDGLSFLWTQLGGVPAWVTLGGAGSDTATFTPTRAGTYTFQVDVDDGMGGTASATVAETVTNAVPLANAGPDQAGMLKTVVITLDGSLSTDADASDLPLLYAWTVVNSPEPVTFSAPGAAVTTFTPTLAGTYEFNLTVDDQDNGTDWDLVTVTVWGEPPVANVTANRTAALVGESILFNGSASTDPDGNIVNYSFNFGEGNTSFGPLNTTSFAFGVAGTFNVTLTVTDDEGNTSTDMVVVVITAVVVDLPPIADAGADQTGNVGASLTFTSLSTDDLGITATSWNFGDGPANTTGNATTHTYTAVGTYVVTLWVWDVLGQNDSDTLTVTVVQPNRFPVLTASQSANTVETGTEVTLIATATDLDNDPLTYAWSQTAGPIVDLVTTTGGNRTFTPTEAGNYTFSVTVSDGRGGSATHVINLTVTAPPTPPPQDNTMLIVGAILALLVVLVLAALMASRKKKKPAEDEDAGEMEEDEEEHEAEEDDEKAEEISEDAETETDEDSEEDADEDKK